MLKHLTLAAALTIACLTAHPVYAQSTTETAKAAPGNDERHYYRLDFTIKEVESGKTINSRSYSTMASTHQKTEVRTGTKLPYGSAQTNSLHYLDLGVSIDCIDPVQMGNQLSVRIKVDVSSVADDGDKNPSGVPIIRQNAWDSVVILPLSQATTIYSSDDLTSKRKMQLEVLATPVR